MRRAPDRAAPALVAAALALGLVPAAAARAQDDAPARLERAREIARLEDARDAAAVPLLVEWMNDTELRVSIRARAARALGRLRSDAAVEALAEAARSPDAPVRHEAVFALGQIGAAHRAGLAALARARASDDPRTRALAAEATGKLGGEANVAAVAELLHEDPDPEVRALAAVALGRIGAPVCIPALRGALAAEKEPRVRELIAWGFDGAFRALAQVATAPPPEDGEAAAVARARASEANGALRAGRDAILRPAQTDPHPRVRATLWRALYRLPEALLPAPEAASVASDGPVEVTLWTIAVVRRQGLRAAAAKDRAALGAVIARLVPATRRASFHVRRAALVALGEVVAARSSEIDPPERAWSDEEEKEAVSLADLVEIARAAIADERRTVRAAALATLARLDPAAGEAAARERLGDRDPAVRAGAIAALAIALGEEAPAALGELFARAEDRRARLACVEALGGLPEAVQKSEPARALALAALAIDDLAVRGSAVALVAAIDAPDEARAGAVAALAKAYGASDGRGFYEVREDIVRRLGDMGDAGAVKVLEAALGDPMASVRKLAAEALTKITGKPRSAPVVAAADDAPAKPVFAAEPATADRPALEALPPDAAGDPAPEELRLRIETERGTIVLELFARDAPVHVRNVIGLARRGFYDGLVIHRVVSDFVVQGGCPRGDGWGDPGYTLRDEINPHRYERGVLGMPKAGDDTGGCQLFIMHSAHPHLDGRYTSFGRVRSGLDVLDDLEEGDRILRVRVVREGETEGS